MTTTTKPAAKPAAKPASNSTTKPAAAKPAPAPKVGSVTDLGRDDKRALGTALITAAAAVMDLDFTKIDALKHLNRKAALQQVANWLAYIPGDWDGRLPAPTV